MGIKICLLSKERKEYLGSILKQAGCGVAEGV